MDMQSKLVNCVVEAIRRDKAARDAARIANTESLDANLALREAWGELRRYQDEVVGAALGE